MILSVLASIFLPAAIAGPQYEKHPDYIVDLKSTIGGTEIRIDEDSNVQLLVQSIPYQGINRDLFMFGKNGNGNPPLFLDALDFCQKSAAKCDDSKWTAILRDPPKYDFTAGPQPEKFSSPFDDYTGSLTEFYPDGATFEFTFKNGDECGRMVAEWNASCVDPVSAYKVIQGSLPAEQEEGEE